MPILLALSADGIDPISTDYRRFAAVHGVESKMSATHGITDVR